MMPAGAAPSAAPAPPAAAEFVAPAHWQAIDFISDLHLSEALPRTFAAWQAHLSTTSADAVFILGDLFELWVGDDARTRAFEQRCVAVLAGAAKERNLAFMVGNRDFLVGPDLLQDCRMTALADPTVLVAWGQRVLLSHGDALCLSDTPYQAFRRMVRSAAWQAEFLAKPLDERLTVAAQIRAASEQRRRFDGDSSADVDEAAAVGWLQAAQARTLVHGHTHRPAQHFLPGGHDRLVLSDWDLDQGDRAEVLRLTPAGFARRPPSSAHDGDTA